MSGLKMGGFNGAGALLDVVESWNGLHGGIGNQPQSQPSDFRSAAWLAINPSTAIMFPSVSGSVGSLAFDATVGRIIQTWASAAAPTSMVSNEATLAGFPFWKRFALAASIPAAFLSPFRRYRVDYLVRVTVAGTADVQCGAAYDGTPFLALNNPAAMWCSRPGTNAGRWMPRHRLVTAGAVIDGPDSGVTPAGWHQLSLVYTEGLIPRLAWLIDGRQVQELAGDAAMISPIAGAFPCHLNKSIGSPVGTTAQFAETRFRCEEVG